MGYKFQDSTATYQATWTSSTAQNTALPAYGWGYSTAIATIQVSGTVTAGAVSFQGYDGQNWYNLTATDLYAGAKTQTYSLANGSAALAADMTGFSQFQVKLTTAISGSGSVQVNINESGAAVSSLVAGGSGSFVATANTPSILSSATALSANTNRKGWQIQNVGTNPLFVLLGSGASTTVFHAVLKGGSANSDGLGGSISQTSGVVYTGQITTAGTSPLYVVMEL